MTINYIQFKLINDWFPHSLYNIPAMDNHWPLATPSLDFTNVIQDLKYYLWFLREHSTLRPFSKLEQGYIHSISFLYHIRNANMVNNLE